jgi:signal transduction histidine kinase
MTMTEIRKHPLLSSLRLKTVLTVFIVCLLTASAALTFVLVSRIFHRFDASVRNDLEWKALRGARELASVDELGLTLGDPRMIAEETAELRASADVLAVVATDAKGAVLARFGAPLTEAEIAAIFATAPGTVGSTSRYVWSRVVASIERKTVGQVAVLVSLTRLDQANQLRRGILVLTAAGLVVALFVSLFFVNFYLGPLLRFTEKTLRDLKNLNATLEERVDVRTRELSTSLETLKNTQRQLADASRRAGKAEVATTVLHNVGNVLNSVNVSCNLVGDKIRQSRVAGIGKLADLLRTNQAQLGPFFTESAQGRKFIEYLTALGEAFTAQRTSVLAELEGMQKNVDHIKTIVSHQQTLAKHVVGALEPFVISELIEEAFHFNSPSFDRHAVSFVREFGELPPIKADRHKLLQIVMNLLSNARHALKDLDPEATRRITIRIKPAGEQRFQLEVEDTGCGIPVQNLERIFNYGFTTKKDGHGFGLHSSSCVAAEMGGSLCVHSDGPGQGARFTLELPIDAQSAAQKSVAA